MTNELHTTAATNIARTTCTFTAIANTIIAAQETVLGTNFVNVAIATAKTSTSTAL